MTNRFLHRQIREKGGAYGAGARYGSGIFSFYSYRYVHMTVFIVATIVGFMFYVSAIHMYMLAVPCGSLYLVLTLLLMYIHVQVWVST